MPTAWSSTRIPMGTSYADADATVPGSDRELAKMQFGRFDGCQHRATSCRRIPSWHDPASTARKAMSVEVDDAIEIIEAKDGRHRRCTPHSGRGRRRNDRCRLRSRKGRLLYIRTDRRGQPWSVRSRGSVDGRETWKPSVSRQIDMAATWLTLRGQSNDCTPKR